MGFLDKLFGNGNDEPQRQPTGNTGAFGYGQQQPNAYGQQQSYNAPNPNRPQNADEQAVARYRYMLQTAPPEDIERAHEESFSRLSPEQRQMVLQQLTQSVPEAEARGLSNHPRALARAATRAEVRQPGFIERTFGGQQPMQGQQGYQQGYQQQQPMGGGMMGGMGGGMMGGMGGMIAGGLLSSMAGSFIGSSIAHSFFSNNSNEQAFQASPEASAVEGGVSDFNPVDFQSGGGGLDASADPYGDPGDGVQDAGFDQGAGGLDSSADSYGDPGDAGGFDGGFDSGGFDGGFDGGGDF